MIEIKTDVLRVKNADGTWQTITAIAPDVTKSYVDAELAKKQDDLSETHEYNEKSNANATINDGYYWTRAQSSSSYVYAGIDVQEGDIVTSESDGYVESIRFTDAYHDGTRVDSACVNGTIKSYTVPAGVNKVYLSCYSSNKAIMNFFIVRKTTVNSVKYVTKLENAVFKNGTFKASAQEVTAGSDIIICRNVDNKKNCVYHAECFYNVSFGGVTIYHGKDIDYGSKVTVTSTNVIVYSGNGTVVSNTEHGLNIVTVLSVLIDVHNSNEAKASITVRSAFGQYTVDNVSFGGCKGSVGVYADTAIKKIEASYTLRDVVNDVWVFGDSYTSIGDPNRWTHQLMELGYNNVLISGYSGAKSLGEIESVRNLLKVQKPRIIVWCLGMNDSDNAGKINEDWKAGIDELETLCDLYGIELILATIPNVPSIRHDFKNTYVRNSGHRYVDFATAVNGDFVGSNWYTGMLSSDNVHPTKTGAYALMHRVITDVAELLVH